jgi:hypothetical protein
LTTWCKKLLYKKALTNVTQSKKKCKDCLIHRWINCFLRGSCYLVEKAQKSFKLEVKNPWKETKRLLTWFFSKFKIKFVPGKFNVEPEKIKRKRSKKVFFNIWIGFKALKAPLKAFFLKNIYNFIDSNGVQVFYSKIIRRLVARMQECYSTTNNPSIHCFLVTDSPSNNFILL